MNPRRQLNIARFAAATLAVFSMSFVFDYLVHSILLPPQYMATADVWRSEEETLALLPWSAAHQFFFAAIYVFLFTLNYEERGWLEGVRFGLVTGVLFALLNTSMFAYLPLPVEIPVAWGAAQIIHAVLAGILAALIYRHPPR